MHVSTLSSMRGSPSTRLLKSHAQHKPARTNAPRRAHSQIVAQRDARAVEQQRVGRQPAGLAGMWRTAVTTAAALTVLGGSGGGVLPAHAATELNPLAKVFQEDVAKLREEREVVRRDIEMELKRLEALRTVRESRAKDELELLRIKGEKEARESQESSALLCATPFGVDVVGISQTLGLLGAIGGGLVARNRKKEMEELNEKLRSVNAVLRQQARAGVTVAPGLSYVPGIEANYDEQPSAQDAASDAEVVRATLKEGKRMLREEPPRSGAAMVQFKKALMLARKDENLKVQERRAMRGLAAAKRQQGDMKGAIADLKEVLDLSQRIRDYVGDTDALGSIADMYTELGDLEQAGKYYDMYLLQLKADEDMEVV